MNTPAEINRLRLRIVAQLLADLNQDVVFVGGATVSLYANTITSADVRPTNDVDVVVELATYGSYGDLDARLRQLGFQNDLMSGVICRYHVQGITVDIMPTDPSVLGFSNCWYADGFREAIDYNLDNQTIIKIFALPYFVASKWEACKGRGGEDLRWSTDFEDIVFVLDQVADAELQLRQAPDAVQIYFRHEFGSLLNRADLEECIYVHLEPRFASSRTQRIIQLLTKLSG
jgi:predicted nucleotidyltransferase